VSLKFLEWPDARDQRFERLIEILNAQIHGLATTWEGRSRSAVASTRGGRPADVEQHLTGCGVRDIGPAKLAHRNHATAFCLGDLPDVPDQSFLS
jgi:hypothetical protein